ncbi:hypothetical protein MUP46_00750 [Patescibacteria group bacterium]|nr:hypothetical protein [Patescibacteria group bacterium]
MKYLIAVIIIFSLVLFPNSVLAWPEPKYVKVGFLKWGDTGVQWTEDARIALIVAKNPVPPFLNATQAGRWRLASPSARPRLAELYGVPKAVAKICGAFYLETESNTQYGYPAGYTMGEISP